MSKKISSLSAGSLVKLNENGAAKKYIMLGYNHYGKKEVTLLRKDCIGLRAYNAASSSNNPYNGNPLDSFCNQQHIQCLDPIIRACLVNVPIPTTNGYLTSFELDSTVRNLMRKCFSLSAAEVGNGDSDGTVFSYLNTAANRIAYQDETDKTFAWWLRSPSPGSRVKAYYVHGDGAVQNDGNIMIADGYCARPALALSSEIMVSDSVDSSGCYTIVSVPAGEAYQKVNGVWMRMC